MTRFFRTTFSVSITGLFLTLITGIATGVHVPFLSFSCVLFGLLIFLLPNVLQKYGDKSRLFALLGAVTALLGFLPILLLRCPTFHYVTHGLFILSGAIFLGLLRHNTTYNNFKAKFGFVTAVTICLLVFVLVLATTPFKYKYSADGTLLLNRENTNVAMNDVIAYAIVSLASGFLCLRGLRGEKGVVSEKSFRRRQLRDALIFAGTVSIVFSAMPLFRIVWQFLLNNVLAPFAQLLVRLLEKTGISVMQQPSQILSGSPQPTAAPPTLSPEASSGSALPPEQIVPATLKSSTPLLFALTSLLLLIVLGIAAFILVKALRRLKQNDTGYPNESREALPETEQPKKEEKISRRSADPRARIRYLYADFLRRLRRISPKPQDGSPDIAAAGERLPPSNAWGAEDHSAMDRFRSEVASLPGSTSGHAYLYLREESQRNELSSNLMKLFDPRARRKKTDTAARIFRTKTCREIERCAQDLSHADEADLAAFTECYERARYHTGEDPSSEDAVNMAELFDRIKSRL